MAAPETPMSECRPMDTILGRVLWSSYVDVAYLESIERDIDESTFKAEADQVLQRVDYPKILQALSNQGLAVIGEDARSSVHQTIGFLKRTKDKEEYDNIVKDYFVQEVGSTIAEYSESHSSISPSESTTSLGPSEVSPPPYSRAGGTQELDNTEIQTPNVAENDISKYTSRLWEQAATWGELPTVTDELLRSFPSLFKVTITLRGTQADGEASTKKKAKHIASKQLCQELRIRL